MTGLALFETKQFALRMRETGGAKSSQGWLAAPSRAVAGVAIKLPPATSGACEFKDLSGRDGPALDIAQKDWFGPQPRLLLRNFVRPQRLEVACPTAWPMASHVIVTPRIEIYSPETLRTLRIGILCTGVGLWLIASFVMRLLSSSAR